VSTGRLTSVEGWRLFDVGDDGTLLPPFTNRYWAASGPATGPWGGTGRTAAWLALAYCAAGGDHAAPAEDCTCGLRATEDLPELLAAVTERPFAGSDRSILDDCGAIARVKLSGKILPGVDMPTDDPFTTWRGSQAAVLDVHLAPGLERHQEAVEARYNVAVKTYSADQWPHAVAPLPPAAPRPDAQPRSIYAEPTYSAPTAAARTAFCQAIKPLGFGRKSTAEPEQFLPMAEDMIGAMRNGVTPTDLARVLFDSDAHPSWEQIRAFTLAIVEHLAPDLQHVSDGPVFAAGVTLGEKLNRSALNALGLRQ
jgi:hypothetical protein